LIVLLRLMAVLKKILIIRFSSIGDIVLTTPVVRCLKNQLPEVEVHFVTKKAFAGVVNNNNFIDKVHLLDDNLDVLLQQLKAENFDFIVDLHNNLRSKRVMLALGKPGAAFNKLNVAKWFKVNFKIDFLPAVHIVDRYMETVQKLGVINDQKGLDFFIADKDEVDLTTLGHPWSNGYVAMVIGANHATKRMPPEKMAEVIEKMKLPVVLIGGKDDLKVAEIVQGRFPELVMNVCGKFNLSQSASLVRQARFVITHDTGLMHIAAAFHQRILSVWGNTIPGFGMTPYLPDGKGESVIIENNSLSCRPCSKIGYDKCPKSHFKCMNELNVNDLVKIAHSWWLPT
jgi:ADP-heptose:LPS heptosyltransferase